MSNPSYQDLKAGVEPPAAAPKLYAGPKEIAEVIGGWWGGKVTTYLYTHPDTRDAEFATFRVEPGKKQEDGTRNKKDFFQASPIPTTAGQGWEMKAPKGLRPLYNRKRVRDSVAVIVVEGEKCVHALHGLDIVATTAPGGANAPDKADWEPLRNKEVYIWPDPDAAGTKYAQVVYEKANAVNARCYLLTPGLLGLTDKEDAFEFCAKCLKDAEGNKDLAKRLVIDAIAEASTEIHPVVQAQANQMQDTIWREPNASDGVADLLHAMATGAHAVHDMPWERLSDLTNALKPGTLTVICGDPGDGKSFLLLQLMAHLHDAQVPTATLELEEDRDYFLLRTLAQRARLPSLTNSKWVQEHPEYAKQAMGEHRDWLAGFGATMSDAPDKVATYDSLLVWIKKQCEAGKRVIAIDPITAIETGRDSFKEDSNFVLESKALMRRYKASLIIITHPRGGIKGMPGNDDLAGGRAWSRFTQTVLWIKKFDEDHAGDVWVKSLGGGAVKDYLTYNRAIKLIKHRNGVGWSHGIAYQFNPQNLCFIERGPIIPPLPEVKTKGKRNP